MPHRNENGQGLIEYALILVLIGVAVIVGVVLVGDALNPRPQPVATNSNWDQSNVLLGDRLVFPEGWAPVAFTADNKGVNGTNSGYLFICARNGEYRFCTPQVLSGD